MRISASLFAAALLLAGAAGPLEAAERSNAAQPSEAWEFIRGELYAARPIRDDSPMVVLDTPYRAHDAATVPVEIRVSPDAGLEPRRMALVVDENPMPVAAEFEFGPGLGKDIALSTRVRVNAYSNVRVIVEMSDGQLYQAANFVKATGGCSAPALKDAEQALASVGRMKVRRFEPQMTEASTSALREMQLMVRHPNYSGFQIDQVSQLHIPAYFVDEMEVRQGDELLFRMTGGISLSEDPTVRFSYVPNKAGSISVRVHDTDDATYTGDFPATPEG